MLIYSNIIFGIPNILGGFYYIFFLSLFFFIIACRVCVCIYVLEFFEGKMIAIESKFCTLTTI